MFKLKDYVLEISRTGSFSQASKNLYVSQPSLSIAIKRLEDKIGVPLFDRSTHPIRLTDFGTAYLKAAKMISDAENSFLAFLDEYNNYNTGSLTIGGSNMMLSFVLPGIVRCFHEHFPKIQLKIVEGNINSLMKQLQESDLDLVLDCCDVDPNEIEESQYKQEALLLVIPSSMGCDEKLAPYSLSLCDILQNRHCSKDTLELPLNLLGDMPFIFMTQETDTYKRATQICLRYNFKPNILMSFSQQSTVFNMVCANMGAAFISDILIKGLRYNAALNYYKLNTDVSCRYIKIYQKRGRFTTPAMRAFYRTAEELATSDCS